MFNIFILMNIYFSNWHKIKNLYKIIKKKKNYWNQKLNNVRNLVFIWSISILYVAFIQYFFMNFEHVLLILVQLQNISISSQKISQQSCIFFMNIIQIYFFLNIVNVFCIFCNFFSHSMYEYITRIWIYFITFYVRLYFFCS